MLDHVLDPVLRGAPGRPGEPKGLVPATTPCAEYVGIGYGRKVIPVQVRDEDVVDLVQRNPRGQVVGDGARTHVEDEPVAIPQLDVDGRAHLTRAGQRRAPHEGDADLAGLYLLRAGEPVGYALQPRHRCDAVEHEPFLPTT